MGWEAFLDVKSKKKQKTELETKISLLLELLKLRGKKVLEFLIKKTLEQPTWVPGGDHSFGYVREGQNSIIRNQY